MEIKKGLEVSTSDFWYDLTQGGYIDPYKICENKSDADKVLEAMKVLKEFEISCQNQIEDFIQ